MQINIEERFLSYLRVEKGLAPNTLLAYQSDYEKLKSFAAELGKDVLTIEREDLQRFIQKLHQSGLEAKSIGRTLVTVRNLYKYLLLDGIIKRDSPWNLEK